MVEGKKLLETKAVSLLYSEKLKVAFLTWKDVNLSFEEYKKPFMFLDEEFDGPILGVVSDLRNQRVVGPEYRNWLQDYIHPRAAKRGVRFMVAITDDNFFRTYYVNMFIKLTAKLGGIQKKAFNKESLCLQWVNSKVKQLEAINA